MLETRRNPFIASWLCEIGFFVFFSLVGRHARLRSLPLQHSECVRRLRWAITIRYEWAREEKAAGLAKSTPRPALRSYATSRNPLIPGWLCEIGFVSSFSLLPCDRHQRPAQGVSRPFYQPGIKSLLVRGYKSLKIQTCSVRDGQIRSQACPNALTVACVPGSSRAPSRVATSSPAISFSEMTTRRTT